MDKKKIRKKNSWRNIKQIAEKKRKEKTKNGRIKNKFTGLTVNRIIGIKQSPPPPPTTITTTMTFLKKSQRNMLKRKICKLHLLNAVNKVAKMYLFSIIDQLVSIITAD